MVFFSSLMLWLQPAGIFPKFWSIPSLISPSARTIPDTVSVLIPHILVVSISRSLYFESFSIMTLSRCFRRIVPLHRLQHRLAWSLIRLYPYASALLLLLLLLLCPLDVIHKLLEWLCSHMALQPHKHWSYLNG